MRLILDGRLSATQASGHQIISQVEDYLQQASAEDRVLISCRVDGAEVDDPVEVIKKKLPGVSLETVEIVTRKREDLVRETVVSLAEYLENLVPAILELAGSASSGKTPDAGLWRQVAEGLEWMMAACAGLSNQHLHLPTLGNALGDIVAQVSKTFLRILEAMEIKDTVAVADILEYELTDQLEQIRRVLNSCIAFWQTRKDIKA